MDDYWSCFKITHKAKQPLFKDEESEFVFSIKSEIRKEYEDSKSTLVGKATSYIINHNRVLEMVDHFMMYSIWMV